MANENSTGPIEAGEREDEIVRTMKIMIAWIVGVVIAGIVLVMLSDPFAALFSMSVPVV